MTFHPKKGDHVIITSRYAVKDGVLLGGQRGRCVGSVYLNSGLWMYEIRLDAVGVVVQRNAQELGRIFESAPGPCNCDESGCPGITLDEDGRIKRIEHTSCGWCLREWSTPTPAGRCLFEGDCDDNDLPELDDIEDSPRLTALLTEPSVFDQPDELLHAPDYKDFQDAESALADRRFAGWVRARS